MTTYTTSARSAQHFADCLALYQQVKTDLILTHIEEEEESERLAELLTAAEDYVMAHGAPDLRGVLAKLEIATIDGRAGEAGWMDSIKSDIMRLGGIDRSPSFLPLEWLDCFERAGGSTSRAPDNSVRLSFSPGSDRAAFMLAELKDHERAAIGDHLEARLPPFGEL